MCGVCSGDMKKKIAPLIESVSESTAVVDFFVHPGMFGDEATEAIVTGCVAAGFSYAVGSGMQVMRRRRAVR